MDINKTVDELEKEILAYKTGQGTSGDSANYYTVTYECGYFISETPKTREHTIKCVPKNNNEKAIFMARLPQNGLSGLGSTSEGRLPTYPQDIITWLQTSNTQEYMSNPGLAIGVGKSITIISNVDFYIETSYVEKSI